jgi:DsbC/DsbD-like thiol-disulfide interchange protein
MTPLSIFLAAFVCWTAPDSSGSRAGFSPTLGVANVGEIPAVTVGVGDSVLVAIPIVIADGYHVQANPASSEFLIPLQLVLEPADGIRFGSPRYPRPSALRLEGTTEDLMTYHGTVSISVLVKASGVAAVGRRLLTGSLAYQACDSSRCLFPSSVPLAFALIVSDASAGD